MFSRLDRYCFYALQISRACRIFLTNRVFTGCHPVSIPFKREGLSEQRLTWRRISKLTPSFNSLQTGRSFRTRTGKFSLIAGTNECFDSLQTGRSFRTLYVTFMLTRITMSFDSLQTGRSFRTRKEGEQYLFDWNCVSIPFKREGLSELVVGGHKFVFTK